MNNIHYEIILSLYKKKVKSIDIQDEVKELHTAALIELDKLVVNSQSTQDQELYIKELQELLYEYF